MNGGMVTQFVMLFATLPTLYCVCLEFQYWRVIICDGLASCPVCYLAFWPVLSGLDSRIYN